MDEVDKIIIHSLRQIGCSLDTDGEEDGFVLADFSPELLFKAVAKCLKEIRPHLVVPESLARNVAQRFAAATALAEACSDCGYNGDIGYQTFLYPNEVDVRRLLMFLIEQLPKAQNHGLTSNELSDENDLAHLVKEIKRKIAMQLAAPWIPQYCCGISSKRYQGTNINPIDFSPQLNLHVPQCLTEAQEKETAYQIPNIFQQTAFGDYDLVSSVLHKCSMELYDQGSSIKEMPQNDTNDFGYIPIDVGNANTRSDMPVGNEATRTLPTKAEEVETLKKEIEACVKSQQVLSVELIDVQQAHRQAENNLQSLKVERKLHERCCGILDNPTDNIKALEGLIKKTKERRVVLESQWQQYRDPILKQIEASQKNWQSKNIENMHQINAIIKGLEAQLKEKTQTHALLAEELKKTSVGLANRKEYTRRIYEFISNIRKQRNDIFKILDDTRELQKQINSVCAQLQRQFNYTDDLLFQSAKHDVHAKQAYKLLASLHASCNAIGDLVSLTGQATKESRDIEVQIDRERMRNVAASLDQITLDIKQFEAVIKSLQLQINTVENEIHGM